MSYSFRGAIFLYSISGFHKFWTNIAGICTFRHSFLTLISSFVRDNNIFHLESFHSLILPLSSLHLHPLFSHCISFFSAHLRSIHSVCSPSSHLFSHRLLILYFYGIKLDDFEFISINVTTLLTSCRMSGQPSLPLRWEPFFVLGCLLLP